MNRLLAVFLLASSPVVAQSVVTVDAGGGGNFTDIQSAIDAAAVGDVVLVGDGTYPTFDLDKGVSVVADSGALVRITGAAGSVTTSVSGIPAGARALIRGLVFAPPSNLESEVLTVSACAGTVWVEEVSFEMPPALPFLYMLNQNQAMKVDDCDQMVLVDSVVPGARGAAQGFGLEAGSIALSVSSSSMFVHGCQFVGGGSTALGGTGRTGILVNGGLLVLRDSQATGGAGGDAVFAPGGDGGPGITVSGGAIVWSIGTDLVGGPGANGPFVNPAGNPGPPSLVTAGTLNQVVAANATLSATRLVREGQDVQITLQSTPDSPAYLFANLISVPVFAPGLPGFLGVGAAPLIAALGNTDALGALDYTIPVTSMPPGIVTWSAAVQMAVIAPSGRLEFSTPSVFTVIDDVF